MRTLVIQNNYHLVPELKDKFDVFLFFPVFHSEIQRLFFEKRFNELKKIIPELRWINEINLSTVDKVLSWDAIKEKKQFTSKLISKQNRLFSQLTFSIPEVFTSFREKAETLLPAFYTDAKEPYDQEVIYAIKTYFREKKLAKTYFETRNALTGEDFSTKMSSFLSSGALDVRYLYNEVKRFEEKFGPNKSTYWIIFELLWREFFYWHYQKHQVLYFSDHGLKGPKQFSPIKTYSIEELTSLDGHPFFKAALKELCSTGFLSNRARQMFASFWLNDLKLSWRSGARFFEEHLIDYDVYSNYGNWMYLAGVGVDPRGKRYFNIDKQLSIYDPEGKYLKDFG